MSKNKILSAMLAIICAFLSVQISAQSIDFSDRTVLLSVDQENLQSLRADSNNRVSLPFFREKEAREDTAQFAVYIGSASPSSAKPPVAELNGTSLFGDVFPRNDGFLFRLPSHLLNDHANLITVAYPTSDSHQGDLVVFQLLDTFEDVHFNRAFGEARGSFAKAPPIAKDPNMDLYDVTHYDIDIEITTASRFISGAVTIEGQLLQPNVTQVVLDFETTGGSITISQVDTGVGSTPLTFSRKDSNRRLVVNLPASMTSSQQFSFRVVYSGTPPTSIHSFGLLAYNRKTTGVPNPVIYTFSEPYGARRWWPCKDLPEDRATVSMRITCPDGVTAVTNGRLVSQTNLAGSTQVFQYEHGYPLSTYLVSIAATNYLSATATYTGLDGQTTMPVTHYVYTDSQAEANNVGATVDILEFLADRFGEYPFIDEKYANAVWGAGFGMEHTTATSINDNNLLDDGGFSRRNIHETAHQWFGDLVTNETFDHLWLQEGFATYCEALFYEQRDGRQAYFDYVNSWISTGINTSRPMVSSTSDDFAGSNVYRKGGFVLHMLRYVVGDENFYNATRNYLSDNAFGTVVTEDLRFAMESEYNKTLEPFFQQWAYGTGVPTYQATWQRNASNPDLLDVTLTQSQAEPTFVMPVEIQFESLNGDRIETFRLENDQRVQTFSIETDLDPWNGIIDPDGYILKNVTSSSQPTMLVAASNASNEVLIWDTGGSSTGVSIAQRTTDDYNVLGSFTGSVFGTSDVRLQLLSPTSSPTDFRMKSASSNETDLYGTYTPTGISDADRVLVVDANDRWDSQNSSTPFHPWAEQNGRLLGDLGIAYDTCANEALANYISLDDYAAVVWVCGEESTADETFSDFEQGLIEDYLDSGGRLFVHGAEIAWDLDWRGTTSDKAFYNNYLKSDYVADASGVYSVAGSTSSILNGLNFVYGNQDGNSYGVQYPDVILPVNGASSCLEYIGGAIAGVSYKGPFGASLNEGAVVHFGFPLETMSTADRNTQLEVMYRIINYFDVAATSPVENMTLDYWLIQ